MDVPQTMKPISTALGTKSKTDWKYKRDQCLPSLEAHLSALCFFSFCFVSPFPSAFYCLKRAGALILRPQYTRLITYIGISLLQTHIFKDPEIQEHGLVTKKWTFLLHLPFSHFTRYMQLSSGEKFSLPPHFCLKMGSYHAPHPSMLLGRWPSCIDQ